MKTLKHACLAFAVLLLTGFSGCASAPQTPQQSVYAAKTAYATALTVAVAYKRLPACTPDRAPPCSDPAIVAQLQKADKVAAAALDAAESAVRTPGFGKDVVATAIASADQALKAFVAITKTLNLGDPK